VRGAWIVAAALWFAPARAQDPFPTDKTVELAEDGKRWFVRGRQVIPPSVSVMNMRATTIQGYDEESVIEVGGSLTLKAVKGGTVVLDNVWIELTPQTKEIYFTNCRFKGGGLRTSPRGATSAKIYCDAVDFDEQASCSFNFAAGSLDFYNGGTFQPLVIRGVPQSDKAGNKARVALQAWNGTERAIRRGLIVEGIADVLVRNCNLMGELTRFADWNKLDFDGNYAHSTLTQFEQPGYGRFRGTSVHNVDFGGEKIEFRCPAKEGKAEKLQVDHCWFRGMTEPATICKSMLREHTSDPAIGVEIGFKRICPQPLGLGGLVR
jgi:hypothetical protein